MSIWSIILTFFLVANPVGNSPAIIALIKDFDFATQKRIMIRESILSFIIALFFQFCGEVFLNLLHVKPYSVTLSGGILLLIVAINMIFPRPQDEKAASKEEPVFVPIATPLISGPALMTIVMLYSNQEANTIKITSAIAITWIAISAVLILSPYMNKILGRRGLCALEQLMGLLLTMMSVGMITKGIKIFMETLQ